MYISFSNETFQSEFFSLLVWSYDFLYAYTHRENSWYKKSSRAMIFYSLYVTETHNFNCPRKEDKNRSSLLLLMLAVIHFSLLFLIGLNGITATSNIVRAEIDVIEGVQLAKKKTLCSFARYLVTYLFHFNSTFYVQLPIPC